MRDFTELILVPVVPMSAQKDTLLNILQISSSLGIRQGGYMADSEEFLGDRFEELIVEMLGEVFVAQHMVNPAAFLVGVSGVAETIKLHERLLNAHGADGHVSEAPRVNRFEKELLRALEYLWDGRDETYISMPSITEVPEAAEPDFDELLVRAAHSPLRLDAVKGVLVLKENFEKFRGRIHSQFDRLPLDPGPVRPVTQEEIDRARDAVSRQINRPRVSGGRSWSIDATIFSRRATGDTVRKFQAHSREIAREFGAPHGLSL